MYGRVANLRGSLTFAKGYESLIIKFIDAIFLFLQKEMNFGFVVGVQRNLYEKSSKRT